MRENWRCRQDFDVRPERIRAAPTCRSDREFAHVGLTDGTSFRGCKFVRASAAQDPAGAFDKMEKPPSPIIRAAVAQLAKKSARVKPSWRKRVKWRNVAARKQRTRQRASRSRGFYLTPRAGKSWRGAGNQDSGGEICKTPERWPIGLYVIGIKLLMVAAVDGVVVGAEVSVQFSCVACFCCRPGKRSAISNQLVSMFVKPRALPKMDYSEEYQRRENAGGVPTCCEREQWNAPVRNLKSILGNRDQHSFCIAHDPL